MSDSRGPRRRELSKRDRRGAGQKYTYVYICMFVGKGNQFLEPGLLGPLPESEFLGEYSKAVGGVDSEAEEQ